MSYVCLEGVAECVISVRFLASTWGHAGGASKHTAANMRVASHTVVSWRKSFPSHKRKRLTRSSEKHTCVYFPVPAFNKQDTFFRARLEHRISHISSSRLSYQESEAGFEQECVKCSRLRHFWEGYRCASAQSQERRSAQSSAITRQLQLMNEADFCLLTNSFGSADNILTTHG